MSRKEIHELIDKARRSLLAAQRLFRDGDSDFSVSRAYYAMFYTAQALLLSRDIRRSKHSAVIAAFNEHFVKSGEVPAKLFALLRDGFEDRAESDYGLAVITDEQAQAGIAAAHEFVEAVSRRLEQSVDSEP
ncbi:MAG: HEPN domain-containing protein [Nitrospira sp.]|nr:HEPN domain-containing protein [Nitrospira sp.]